MTLRLQPDSRIRGWRCAAALGALTALLACGPAWAGPRKASARPAATPVTVMLTPAFAATEAEVTIGDVATLDGGDAALRRRIAALDLADAPALGTTSRLTPQFVAYRIRLAGVDPQRFRLAGAQSVTLSARGWKVPEQEIVESAKSFLRARLPWKDEDLAIELAQPLRAPVYVTGERTAIRYEPRLQAQRISLGAVRVNVSVLSQGVKQTEVPVTLEVTLSQTVAVAARRIERGQPLTEDNMVFERRAVDAATGYLTESESPIGQRAKRPILPLQVISRSDLDGTEADATVVIRQRDVVKLVARGGGLVVTASGEALQDGRTGQSIRVRNVDSKTVVTGRVVNKNEVQVAY